MGAKYSSQATSGYNSLPPSDDGSQTASNLIAWATIKTKLADVLKTFGEAINTALVAHFDYSVRQITTSDSTVASDHMRCVEIAPTVSASITVSLGDAATMTNVYRVFIRNSSTISQTIGRVTGTDTLDGVAANLTIPSKSSVILQVNAAANGYVTNARSNLVTGGTIDGAVIGGTTPLAGTFTTITGTTITATVGVVTPMVNAASNFVIQSNGASTWNFTATPFDLVPANADNAQSIGSAAARIKQVFTPIVDSGSGSLVLKGAGTTAQTITGANTALAGTLTFSTATSKIIPGATNISHRNTADNADNLLITDAGAVTIRSTLSVTGAVSKVGNITATGTVGVPVVVANARSTGQTAAVASVATFTVGAADASFEIGAYVLVTTATSHSFNCTVTFVDEGNTSRTTNMVFNLPGGAGTTPTIVNTFGAVPYQSFPIQIRAKAATAITIATSGTFTTVTYNVEGTIKQIA